MGWTVSVTSRPCFTPGESIPSTHCTGDWVGHRAGLDKEVRGIISCLNRRSDLDRPVVQSAYRHYTDYTRLPSEDFTATRYRGLQFFQSPFATYICVCGYRGPFPRGLKRGRGVTLTTHPHLVPRSRMSRRYTPLPQAPPLRVVGQL
jgi:hypothetical protein